MLGVLLNQLLSFATVTQTVLSAMVQTASLLSERTYVLIQNLSSREKPLTRVDKSADNSID